jgi:hypothetical protein
MSQKIVIHVPIFLIDLETSNKTARFFQPPVLNQSDVAVEWLLQSSPNSMLQDHCKIVQRCNTNNAVQPSEDGSEFAAQQGQQWRTCDYGGL